MHGSEGMSPNPSRVTLAHTPWRTVAGTHTWGELHPEICPHRSHFLRHVPAPLTALPS